MAQGSTKMTIPGFFRGTGFRCQKIPNHIISPHMDFQILIWTLIPQCLGCSGTAQFNFPIKLWTEINAMRLCHLIKTIPQQSSGYQINEMGWTASFPELHLFQLQIYQTEQNITWKPALSDRRHP